MENILAMIGSILTFIIIIFWGKNFWKYELAFHRFLILLTELLSGFYNWNRVKLRYCDGASFTGDAVFENGVKSMTVNLYLITNIILFNFELDI